MPFLLSRHAITRRRFLASLAAGAAVAALPAWPGTGPALLRRDARVVLVVLGGGVRPQDCLSPSGAMPFLQRLTDQGVLFSACREGSPDPMLAGRALLTGVSEEVTGSPALPGPHPTIFEYLRRQAGAPAEACWLVVSGSGPERFLGFSTDPEHGASLGPCVFAPDLLQTPSARAALNGVRAGEPLTATEAEVVSRLQEHLLERGPVRSSAAVAHPGGTALLGLQAAILDQVRGEETSFAHGASDGRALRAANTILRQCRPRLVAVLLGDARVADQSFADYLEVLRANDRELQALWQTVSEDEALASSTALVVVSDRGRDPAPAPDGSLPRRDRGPRSTRVLLLVCGSHIRRGEVVRPLVQATDVAPTICHLLGAKATQAEGRVLREALT